MVKNIRIFHSFDPFNFNQGFQGINSKSSKTEDRRSNVAFSSSFNRVNFENRSVFNHLTFSVSVALNVENPNVNSHYCEVSIQVGTEGGVPGDDTVVINDHTRIINVTNEVHLIQVLLTLILVDTTVVRTVDSDRKTMQVTKLSKNGGYPKCSYGKNKRSLINYQDIECSGGLRSRLI